MMVVGIDGCKNGWVAVFVRDGVFAKAGFHPDMSTLLKDCPDVSIIAVDIPIGTSNVIGRKADLEAREFLGKRASTVFLTPPMQVLEQQTYEQATALARKRWGKGISKQSYALGPKIMEVTKRAKEDERIREVHPEVSFQAMAGIPLQHTKKTWNGFMERRGLLRRVEIEIPDEMGEAGALGAPDDILDAAVAAWSAGRLARGGASSLPAPPEADAHGYPMAIWY
jgi:predicted RNase H-like nuclease